MKALFQRLSGLVIASSMMSWPTLAHGADELRLEDLFRADRALEVRFTVDTSDWDILRRQSRNIREIFSREPGSGPPESPFTYVRADMEIDGVKFPGVGIRKKGFIGSLSESRPSLKVKLNYTDKSLSIDGAKRLTLNNNKQDTSLLSQYLSYGLFRAAELPAPRCSFARVFVNGQDLGVYSHVESIRKPMISREFGDDGGVLYEGTVADFHAGRENDLEHKFGDDDHGREKIQELTALLNRDGGLTSPTYEQEIGAYVDLPSFYSFWAMESLLGFWDGYSGNANNYFFYLNPKTDRFHFLPWGADSLFTEKGPFERNGDAPVSVKVGGLIAYRLYQINEGRERYELELRRLLDQVWDSEALLRESSRVAAILKPWIHQEQGRMENAVGELRTFIQSRKERILAEIENGAPVWAPGAPRPFGMGRGGFGGPPTNWEPEKDPEMILAAKEGDAEKIRALAQDGSSVDIKDRMQRTPISLASIHGHVEAVEALIELGANPNERDERGSTLVHTATFFGIESSVRALAENGAELNARNPEGHTALDIASAPLNEEMGELMEFFASFLQLDIDVDRVRERRPALAEFLKSRGAKLSSELRDVDE